MAWLFEDCVDNIVELVMDQTDQVREFAGLKRIKVSDLTRSKDV